MIQVGTMFNTPLPPAASQGMNAGATTNATYSHQFQPIQFKPFKPPDGEFDGKRLRKSVMRKTVDYNSSVVQLLEARIWQKDERLRPSLPPDICFASQILPPPAYLQNPINAVVTKFVRTSTNKAKCPIFCLAWTPEGRRLITGASSGEFTLWNGLTFNFETILQAHESSVRAMVWSHNDQWMVTGDTSGYVKYWQSNMNNVKMFQAHKDPVRGLRYWKISAQNFEDSVNYLFSLAEFFLIFILLYQIVSPNTLFNKAYHMHFLLTCNIFLPGNCFQEFFVVSLNYSSVD